MDEIEGISDGVSLDQRNLLDLLPMAVVVSNYDGIITYANTAVKECFGYEPEELCRTPIDALVAIDQRHNHDKRRAGYYDEPTRMLMGGRSGGQEVKAQRKDGSVFFAEVGLSGLDAIGGRSVIATVIDVSAMREMQQEVMRSNDELQQFAYVASHDLKAPLRGIAQLASWMMEDRDDPKKVESHFEMLEGRIGRMNGLIDALLQHSRIGRSRKIKTIALKEFIRELYEFSGPPESFRFELRCAVAELTTVVTPFEEMLRNLISNAIKHHDKTDGRIRISVDELPPTSRLTQTLGTLVAGGTGGRVPMIRIEVEDDGPGIDGKFHEKIFGMFETLKPADHVEGSGMGLALIRKICNTFGAHLYLSSAVNQGSRFTILWPRQMSLDDVEVSSVYSLLNLQ